MISKESYLSPELSIIEVEAEELIAYSLELVFEDGSMGDGSDYTFEF